MEDHVKIYFKNNLIIEGIVKEWEEIKDFATISSTKSFVTIRSLKDILMVEIFKSDPLPIRNSSPPKSIPPKQEVKETVSSDLRLKNLIDLKKMQIAEEQNTYRKKLHEPSGLGNISYGLPRSVEEQIIKQHSTSKT